ncbi:MAG: hypothetical protein KY432_08815 [Acidobacteria bacterium]|nr:hypothetical protein [Acidobacteriota bacterium]
MTKSADLPPPPDDYYLEIESHFARRRGTPFVFSARDWALIREWKESGVPLSIVVEAIDSCFDKRQESSRRRTISSLSYCRHAVTELWDERRELQIGAGGTVPELAPSAGVESLASALEQSARDSGESRVRERIAAAAERISSLRSRSVPEIETELIEIEEKLYEDLERLLPERLRRAIEQRLEKSMRDVEFRDELTRARTRDANLRRIVRGELGLPRLSLFG